MKQNLNYKFQCSICNKNWNGTNLKLISKRIANHWNKNHNKKLINSYKKKEIIIIKLSEKLYQNSLKKN